jgi:hypothetical protein
VDRKRFVAWTRRRLVIAAGGLTVSLVALAELETAAKKGKNKGKGRKKKVRCRTLRQTCTKSGKRACCQNRLCGHPLGSDTPNRCCHAGGVPCTPETGSRCCTGICQADNTCFCKAAGQACDSGSQCCSKSCQSGLCT